MQASEALGVLGWLAVGVVLLMAVTALAFGFSKLFYFAIILVPVMFVILLMLCRGPTAHEA